MASTFRIGISRNTKCGNLVGFAKYGHILYLTLYYVHACTYTTKIRGSHSHGGYTYVEPFVSVIKMKSRGQDVFISDQSMS